MQYRDLARLLVKATGLIIFLCGLVDLPRAIVSLLAQNKFYGQMLEIALVPAASLVLTGLLIYWFDKKIVDRTMIDGTAVSNLLESAVFIRLEELCIAVIGFYLIIEGLINLTYYLGMIIIPYEQLHLNMPISVPDKVYSGLTAATMRVLLGGTAIYLSKRIPLWRQRWAKPKSANTSAQNIIPDKSAQ